MDITEKIFDCVQINEARMNNVQIELKGIRKDLAHHIKRTDQLEKVVVPLEKDIWRFKIIGAMIVTLGTGLIALIGWLINILLTKPNLFGS